MSHTLNKTLLLLSLSFFGLLSVHTTVSAQEPFYKGKTVRVVVGFSAGGGIIY